MPRSPHSSQDDHHDQLRTLIGERHARSDLNARSFSEYSDTPSVYSRSYFSPQISDNGDQYDVYHFSEAQSALTPRNDQHQASMLDLDDDPRTSYAPTESYDDDSNESYEGPADGESVPRMSYLGPKMRFHSRAPWEEDDLLEEDEPDDKGHYPPGFPFSRKATPKSVTSGSSSPRPSFSAPSMTRPSVDSSHSRLSEKRSYEAIGSQGSYSRGPLYALAHESMSSSALPRPPLQITPQKDGLFTKLSLTRLRSEPSPMSSSSPLAPPAVIRNTAVNHFTSSATTMTTNSSRTSSDSFDFSSPKKVSSIHPYANPDLVSSLHGDPKESSIHPVKRNGPLRCDSNLTVTESHSSETMKSNTQTTLMSSVNSTSGMSRLRLTSLPKSATPTPLVIGTPKPLLQGGPSSPLSCSPPQLTGWAERSPAAAPFSLISLEEARAQKMRNSASNGTTSSDSATHFPGTVFDTSITSAIETSSSTLSNLASRARGRSISTGSKVKHTFQIKSPPRMDRRESEPAIDASGGPPPGKTLKNKKSGFMRLFNKEKEGLDAQPPVPTLPEIVTQPQVSTHRPTRSIQRVPVPSISPSLQIALTNSTTHETSPLEAYPPNKHPKRATPPALNLASQTRASTTERPRPNFLERPLIEHLPQSAPPNVLDFPVLKLRPVSGFFSSQFGNHVVADGTPRSSMDTDSSTPRSPSPALISPITPISTTRPSHDQGYAYTSDDGMLVRSLQEQMVSQKKAWQSRIWELEAQVRELKTEMDEMKGKQTDAGDWCEQCGRGCKALLQPYSGSVVNRPRARTGTSSRFVSPHP